MMKLQICISFIAALLLITGCKDSPTGSLSPNIHHMRLSISQNNIVQQSLEMDLQIGYTMFDSTAKIAKCSFYGVEGSNPQEIIISYPYGQAGIYLCQGDCSIIVSLRNSSESNQYEKWYANRDTQIFIFDRINKGEQVRGEFRGYFLRNIPTSNDSLYIEAVFDSTVF